MQYLLAIYSAEAAEPEPGTPEFDRHIERYQRLTEAMTEAGVLLAARPLEPVSTATTVRRREGTALMTDGPFAETKEQLGGFYLVECGNLDEAVEWAAQIPSVEFGSVEVRPVLDLG